MILLSTICPESIHDTYLLGCIQYQQTYPTCWFCSPFLAHIKHLPTIYGLRQLANTIRNVQPSEIVVIFGQPLLHRFVLYLYCQLSLTFCVCEIPCLEIWRSPVDVLFLPKGIHSQSMNKPQVVSFDPHYTTIFVVYSRYRIWWCIYIYHNHKNIRMFQ